MKTRIWELDAFRGLCILGMVIVHFLYDLTELYRIIDWSYPAWFSFIKDWGGVLFLLLSGICVTLGSRHIQRGFTVFSCGMACTLATFGMYALGMADSGMVIWFGVLHCLGACMLLWGCFQRLPAGALLSLGAGLASLGLYLGNIRTDHPWLIPLGIMTPGFVSADYFPLLPNLGFFLTGAFLGKTLYRRKESLLPRVDPERGIFPFLRLCGRYSLPVYLLHQPVLTAIFSLWGLI